MPPLLDRLRQRKLVQWALAYGAAAAAAAQGLSLIAEPWGISAGTVRVLQVLILTGFPITLVLAWYHGEKGRQRVSIPEVLFLAVVLVAGGTFVAATSPAPSEQGPRAADPELLQVAVLPPEVGSALPRDTAGLSFLLQEMLASELVGRRGFAIKDPLSFNSRLDSDSAMYAQLHRAGLDYAVRMVVRPARAGALDVAVLLTNASTAAVLLTHRFRNEDEAQLPAQLRDVANRLAERIQQERNIPMRLDLEPWVERAPRRVAASREFLQAAAYAYRGLAGGGVHLQRAVDIDPTFIAPRVWLVSVALNRDPPDSASAHAHVLALKRLSSRASPFEQAMIGWAEARTEGDLERVVQHLMVALHYSPENNILLYELTSTLYELGRMQQAWEAARVAVASRWRYPRLYPLWGVVSIESGNIDGLRATLEMALDYEGASPYVYGLLEALAVRDGDVRAAERYGRILREAAPEALREFIPYYEKLADLASQGGDAAARRRLLAWTEALQ